MCCHPPMRINQKDPSRNQTDISEFKPLLAFSNHPDSSKSLVVKFKTRLEETSRAFHLFEYRLSREKFTKDFIKQCMVRYHQFMLLKKKNPDSYLVPTTDIEMIWISHLLRPHLYEKDCKNLYGKVFDHKLKCSNFEKTIKQEALTETEKVWETEYKTKYLNVKPSPLKEYYSMGARMVEDQRDTKYYHDDEIQTFKTLKSIYSLYDQLSFSFTCDDVLQDRKWYGEYSKFMKNNCSVHMSVDYIKNATGFVKSYERFL
jgi:hypothetical protein